MPLITISIWICCVLPRYSGIRRKQIKIQRKTIKKNNKSNTRGRLRYVKGFECWKSYNSSLLVSFRYCGRRFLKGGILQTFSPIADFLIRIFALIHVFIFVLVFTLFKLNDLCHLLNPTSHRKQRVAWIKKGQTINLGFIISLNKN